MQDVFRAIQTIQKIPGAFVDCNFGQGVDALQRHLMNLWNDQRYLEADRDVDIGRSVMHDLIDWIKPYTLPNDYAFFLEYYGGLSITNDEFRFSIRGIGPASEEDYGYLLDDVAELKGDLLYIAWLKHTNKEPARKSFYLRLHQNNLSSFESASQNKKSLIVVESFSKWLEEIGKELSLSASDNEVH